MVTLLVLVEFQLQLQYNMTFICGWSPGRKFRSIGLWDNNVPSQVSWYLS